MRKGITRRGFLRRSAATGVAGLAAGRAVTAQAAANEGIVGTSPFWGPGPDKTLKKDLNAGPTPVRLGTGMGRKEGESLTEMVKRVYDAGYSGVVTGPEPWHSMKDSELEELRRALKEYDVVVYEVGGYKNMIHPDPRERQNQLAHLVKCLEAAEKIGCPMVGTISGSCDPVDFFNVHPDNWTLETWRLLVKSVKQVLKDTSGMKAALGMEAQVTTNIDGPVSHRRLIDDVGDSRCAVNLDPVNMISLSNYYHTTELLEECFDLLGESILGCHAKDTYIWPDKQTVHVQEVCSGRGVLDYETYLVRISRLEWPRTILPEHIPADQYIEADAYIRSTADKVGVKMYR